MPRKLADRIKTQRLVPWIGEFKETLSQAVFWGSIANMLMVAGTFYFTTLRFVAPWFELHWFIIAIAGVAAVVYVVEYKWIVPSIWAFRGKQMDLRNGEKETGVSKMQYEELKQKLQHIEELLEGRKDAKDQ